MKKVFLGGTCNESTWRDELIPMLKLEYFNPVVKDWTPECQEEELKQRAECDYVLYVITPRMTGVYSIAEAVDDSNKRPDKTLFCFLEKDGDLEFTKGQLKSLGMVKKMIETNNKIDNQDGKCFDTLKEIAEYLNSNKEKRSLIFKKS